MVNRLRFRTCIQISAFLWLASLAPLVVTCFGNTDSISVELFLDCSKTSLVNQLLRLWVQVLRLIVWEQANVGLFLFIFEKNTSEKDKKDLKFLFFFVII